MPKIDIAAVPAQGGTDQQLGCDPDIHRISYNFGVVVEHIGRAYAMGRFWQIAALLAVVSFVATPSLAQDKRIALVIGNSAYKHTPRLHNPGNDAADMAAKLEQVGFDVIVGRDLDKVAMDRTIRDFAEKLAGAHVGLFFYAGHGLQVNGQNYLLPTDAKLTTAAAIDFEMVRLDLVHRTMERETRTNILIVDACRDNPLARNLAGALGTRSSQVGRGLAIVESGEGTLISFSTQPGNVALEGSGRNSPFAGALMKHIATPGEDLLSILINVRNDVMQATARRQIPWEHSAMTAKFHFVPPAPAAAPKSGPDIELEFWASVKDSTSPAVLGTYLERYPDGEFAPIARALIEHYERQLKAEIAAREQERKRLEEEKKAAEVKRLEQERRAREAALAEERRRAEEAKNAAAAKLVDEKQRAEWLARTEELKKALEEVRLAREAAAAAEKQRLAATMAAEEATKAAEKAIAAKRETEKKGDSTRLAALPKIERPPGSLFAGALLVKWRHSSGCRGLRESGAYPVFAGGGKLSGHKGRLSGTISDTGAARWSFPSSRDGVTFNCSATIHGESGSGSCTRAIGHCIMSLSVRRQ
jgi:uncharacterized caspase-like protein